MSDQEQRTNPDENITDSPDRAADKVTGVSANGAASGHHTFDAEA